METQASVRTSTLSRIIRNLDVADHLSCDKKGLLAYLSAIGAPVEQLFYGAWEECSVIFERCYQQGVYRWNYQTRYLGEADWHLIGLYASRADYRLDIDEFKRLSILELEQEHPVLFEAPKGDIGYFRALMKKHSTPLEEYDRSHYYMAIDYDAAEDAYVFFDVFHAQGLIERSPFHEMRSAYASRPDAWFGEAYALHFQPAGVDTTEVQKRHREFVLQSDADVSLYDFMAGIVDYEVGQKRLTFEYGTVNAIAILHGSRWLFSKYLATADYSPEIRKKFVELSNCLSVLQLKINQLFTKVESGIREGVPELQRFVKQRLAHTKTVELDAMTSLKTCLRD